MAMDAKGERKLIIKMESSPLSPFSPKEEGRGKRPALQQLTNMQPLTSQHNHERNTNTLMKSPISLMSSPFATETPPSRGFGDGAVIVEFPPGPMGLVLEPVILSSEREIGCKVKDYYFGIDHQGIDAEKLQDLVEIGDVVTFIGSKNVQSARFTDILDLLRSLKDAKRVITFKNMSISWQENSTGSHKTASVGNSPLVNLFAGVAYNTSTPLLKGGSGSSPLFLSPPKSKTTPLFSPVKRSSAYVSPGRNESRTNDENRSPSVDIYVDKNAKTSSQQPNSIGGGGIFDDDDADEEETKVDPMLMTQLYKAVTPRGNDRSAFSSPESSSAPSSSHSSKSSSLASRSPLPTPTLLPRSDAEKNFSPKAVRSLAQALSSQRVSSGLSTTKGGGDLISPNFELEHGYLPTPTFDRRIRSPHSHSPQETTYDAVAGTVVAPNSRNMSTSGAVMMSPTAPNPPSSRGKSALKKSGSKATPTEANSASLPGVTDGGDSADDSLSYIALDDGDICTRHGDDICPSLSFSAAAVSLPLPPLSMDLQRVLSSVGSSLGAGLISVGNVVGSHAADAAGKVGAVVGAQAEILLSSTAQMVPRFSAHDMGQVMSRKHVLLNELSSSCLQLGQLEDKQREMTGLIENLTLKEAELQEQQRADSSRVALLQDRLREVEESRISDASSAAMQIAQQLAELAAAHDELLAETRTTESVRKQLAAEKALHHAERESTAAVRAQVVALEARTLELTHEMSGLRRELTVESGARIAEKAAWKEDADAAAAESKKRLAEAKQDAEAVRAALAMAERARDSATAELEVLRDMARSDKAQTEADQARMRESVHAQLEWNTQRLLERDGAIHAIRTELSEARASLLEMTKQQDLAVSAKLQLQRELGDAEVAVQREKMAAGRAEGLLAAEQMARQAAEDDARRAKDSLARVQALQQASVQAVDLTNKDLTAATEREQTLRAQISALEEQLRTAHDTAARQATAMAGLEVELASSAQTLKQTMDSERAGVTALADAQSRASEQITALQALLDQQTAVAEQLRLDLVTATTAAEATQVSLAAAQQRGSDAEGAVVTAGEEISTLRADIVTAEAACRDLAAQLEAEKLDAAAKATALQDADAKVIVLQEDVAREMAVRVAAEDAVAALRVSLAESADRCAEADAACEDMRRSADVVCEDLRRQLDQSSASSKVELDQLGAKVAELDQLLAERDDVIRTKDDQLQSMRGEFDDKVRIVAEMEDRIADFGGQIVDKVRVAEDLVTEKDRCVAELSLRDAEHNAAMQASATREADLKQSLLVLEEHQRMLQEQAKIAEEDAQTTRDRADAAAEVIKEELASLRAALDKADALNATHTRELAMQQKEHEAELAKRLEMERACVDLRHQLDEGTSELLVRQVALQEFVATRDAEVSSLRERLDECQHAADAAVASKAVLENELSDFRAQSVEEAKAWQARLADLETEQTNGYEARRREDAMAMRTAFDESLCLVRSELAIIRADTVTHQQHAAASFGSAMLQVQQRVQRVEGERSAQASLLAASEERNVQLRDELEKSATLLQTLEAEACKPLSGLADTDNHTNVSSSSTAEVAAEMLSAERDALQSTLLRVQGELTQASQLCTEQCTALGDFAVKQLRADTELRNLREQLAAQAGVTLVTSAATATAATETDHETIEALLRQEYELEKTAMQAKLQQLQQQQHHLSAGTATLEDRCESLQYDLANKSRTLASLSDDLAAAREMTAMLEGDLRVAEDRLRQADGRETTLLLELQEAKALQQKHRIAADAEVRAERPLADAQAAIGEAHRREDFLRSQLTEVTRQQGRCEEQVETLQREKGDLRAAAAAAHGVSAALDEQLTEARDVIVGLRRRFEESEIRAAAGLQARHAAAAATTSRPTDGDKEYEAERARMQRLEQELSAARATHAEATVRLESAERETEGLRLDARALQISLEGARRETAALTSQTEEMLGAITAQAAALEIAEQRELEHCAQKNKLQDQVLRAQERARDALSRLELVEKEHRVALAAATTARQASQSRLVEDLQLEVAAMHRSLLIAREETAAKEAELEALAAQVTDLISQSLLSPMRPTALTPTRTDAVRSETGAMAVLLESLEQGRRSVVGTTKAAGDAPAAAVGRREALADVTAKVVGDGGTEDFVVEDTDEIDDRRDLALEALLSLHEALSACCRSWVAVYGHRQASEADTNGALQEQALIRASTALRAAYDLLQDPRCSGDGPAPSLPPLPLPSLLTAVPQSPPPPPPPTMADEDRPRYTREPPRYANRRDTEILNNRSHHVPSSSSVTTVAAAEEEEVGSDENCDPLAPPPPPSSPPSSSTQRTAVPQGESSRLFAERARPKVAEKNSVPTAAVISTSSTDTFTTLTGSPPPIVASSASTVASPPSSSSGRKTMMGARLRLSQQQQQQHLQPNHLGIELGLASDAAGTSGSSGYGSTIEDRLLGLGPPRSSSISYVNNMITRSGAASEPDAFAATTTVSSSSSSSSSYVPISVASLGGRGGEQPQGGVHDESFDSTASQASHFWNVSTDSESDLALATHKHQPANNDRHRSRTSSNDPNRPRETTTLRQQQHQGTTTGASADTTSTSSAVRTDLYIPESEDCGFCNFDDTD